RVRITHGPIETLGWAAMTMEFDVLPGASLESIQVGQSVHFALGQSDVGDYVISIIHKPETSGTDSDEGHGIHQEESSS
ncbi:MAG: copper-binding protein, partial [Xanthomonadales bacterium]|nr:copper-binding protein [Xanthomonadales bacterium]